MPHCPKFGILCQFSSQDILIPITNTCFGQQTPLPLDAMLAAQLMSFWSRWPYLGHLAWPHDCRGLPELVSGALSNLFSVPLLLQKKIHWREFHAIQHLSKCIKSGQLIKYSPIVDLWSAEQSTSLLLMEQLCLDTTLKQKQKSYCRTFSNHKCWEWHVLTFQTLLSFTLQKTKLLYNYDPCISFVETHKTGQLIKYWLMVDHALLNCPPPHAWPWSSYDACHPDAQIEILPKWHLFLPSRIGFTIDLFSFCTTQQNKCIIITHMSLVFKIAPLSCT